MKIYTVVAYSEYFDSYDGNTFNINDDGVKSFTTFGAAEKHADALPYGSYEIVENWFYLNETCEYLNETCECEAFKCDCKN
jgi:hypothetical protein